MKEVINPSNVHWPLGYSHVVKAGNKVYISGQIPLDKEGNIVGKGDIATQTEQVYENLKRCLEAAGATMNDIVMLGVKVTDVEDYDKNTRGIRKKYFGKYRPATTCVEISRLYFPEIMIEVEATAIID